MAKIEPEGQNEPQPGEIIDEQAYRSALESGVLRVIYPAGGKCPPEANCKMCDPQP